MFEMIEGGVTSAEGFKAAGCAAGIKKNGSADMALIYCEKPCLVAGTFTSNRVKAAPVKWDRALVKGRTKGEGHCCKLRHCKCMHRQRGHGCLREDGRGRGAGAWH